VTACTLLVWYQHLSRICSCHLLMYRYSLMNYFGVTGLKTVIVIVITFRT